MYDCSNLYLQLQADPAGLAGLRALRGRLTLPAILLVPPSDKKADADLFSRLVEDVQVLEAAALIEDDIDLAQACGADGVHLSPAADLLEQYEKARETLDAESIVGVGVGLSRHNAMTLGEAGADYIAFDASQPIATDVVIEGDEQVELLAWWAEVFEVPCVGLTAGTSERARALLDAGADFIEQDLGSAVAETDLANRIFAFARELPTTNERTLVHE